jgi:hypothetical protein
MDPHQERIQVLGLDESVCALATYAFLLRRYGSHDRLLEAILVPVVHTGRQVPERHAGDAGPVGL